MRNWEVFKQRKKYDVFRILNDRSQEDLYFIAEGLLKNSIYISRQFKTCEMETDELWHSDPFNNRTWRYWVHSLIMIEYLLNAYEVFNNQGYMEKAVELVLSWKRHNISGTRSDMAWHDHAAAHRLIIISRMAELLRQDHFDMQLLEELTSLAEQHCTVIESPRFYQPRHNHGLDQNAAMYAAATVFNHLDKSDFWQRLSFARLKEQLEYLFLSDGSYLEHTPVYSFIFCNRLMRYVHFFRQDGNSECGLIEAVIGKQLHCLTYLVQPDGLIPPIGDGNPSRMSLKHLKGLEPASLAFPEYVLSKGARGIPPPELDMVFARGGYAAMRNKWEYDEETIQVLLYSAFHTKTHKHHDDLSLTLFAYGQPLITDSGKYNFNYNSWERQYVISAYAHNTVVVDGKNTSIDQGQIGKSCLASYHWSEPMAYCSAAHALYKGVIHRRSLLYFKPWDLIVIDFMDSLVEHKYEQVFNFYPGAECRQEGNSVLVFTDGGEKVKITSLLDEDILETSLLKGQKQPWRGWCCLEYNVLQPSWSMGYTKRGGRVFYAAHIDLKPARKVDFAVEQRGDALNINSPHGSVILRLSQEGEELRINGTDIPLQSLGPRAENQNRESKKAGDF
jgi:hypothetical protein